MSIRALGVILAGTLWLTTSATAAATTIVDTGTPTEVGGGSSLVNTGGRFQRLAAQFTLDRPATLTAIEGYLVGQRLRSTFHITLTTSVIAGFNTIPGSTLFSAQATSSSDNFADWSGLSGLNWAVNPGDYWVVFSVNPGDSFNGYMPNGAPSPVGAEAFFNQGSTQWQQKERGLGVRIAGNLGDLPPPPPPPPGVPEPDTWAMMILGFALIGGTMRRRTGRMAVSLAMKHTG